MEYICETGSHKRQAGDPHAVKFTDGEQFVGQYGGTSNAVTITAVDRYGAALTNCTITVKDFLAIARSLKGA